MPINRKTGRYYRGIKGKNIKDVGDAGVKIDFGHKSVEMV